MQRQRSEFHLFKKNRFFFPHLDFWTKCFGFSATTTNIWSAKPASHPVYDAGGVQVLNSAQHLVEQVGQPLVVQLHLDHLAEVGVHQLHHQVPAGTPVRLQHLDSRREETHTDTHTYTSYRLIGWMNCDSGFEVDRLGGSECHPGQVTPKTETSRRRSLSAHPDTTPHSVPALKPKLNQESGGIRRISAR